MSKHTGRDFARAIKEAEEGGKSAGLQVAAKNRLRQLLRIDEEIEKPGLTIFNNCRQLISDLPIIPVGPKGTDDIDPRYASDHIYDALRYGIMNLMQTP